MFIVGLFFLLVAGSSVLCGLIVLQIDNRVFSASIAASLVAIGCFVADGLLSMKGKTSNAANESAQE